MALRTVPVFLKNGNRRIKVNALLDEASTKTYLNADVAAELGLQGHPQSVTVNVLNGQTENFETTPVEVELESLDGKFGWKCEDYHKCIHCRTSHRKHERYRLGKVCGKVHPFEKDTVSKSWHPTNSGLINWN